MDASNRLATDRLLVNEGLLAMNTPEGIRSAWLTSN